MHSVEIKQTKPTGSKLWDVSFKYTTVDDGCAVTLKLNAIPVGQAHNDTCKLMMLRELDCAIHAIKRQLDDLELGTAESREIHRTD